MNLRLGNSPNFVTDFVRSSHFWFNHHIYKPSATHFLVAGGFLFIFASEKMTAVATFLLVFSSHHQNELCREYVADLHYHPKQYFLYAKD